MKASYPDGNGVDPRAVPAAFPTAQEEPDPDVVLDVDGETFALRGDEWGGTHYTWLSGPNTGYGFGSSPTPNWSLDEHRENIRGFLTMIDPTTGYIEDD